MMAIGVYRHYSGTFYQIITVGEHTETKEAMVVYVPLSSEARPGLRVRIRPLAMFSGNVELCGGCGSVAPDCCSRRQHQMTVLAPRFEYIGDEMPNELPV